MLKRAPIPFKSITKKSKEGHNEKEDSDLFFIYD